MFCLEGDDLKEIATDFLRRFVSAGEAKAGYLGEGFGNEDLLQLAGVLVLLFEGRLAAAVVGSIAQDGVDDGSEEKRAQDGLAREAAAEEREQRGAHPRSQRPVGVADALVSEVGDGIPGSRGEGEDGVGGRIGIG